MTTEAITEYPGGFHGQVRDLLPGTAIRGTIRRAGKPDVRGVLVIESPDSSAVNRVFHPQVFQYAYDADFMAGRNDVARLGPKELADGVVVEQSFGRRTTVVWHPDSLNVTDLDGTEDLPAYFREKLAGLDPNHPAAVALFDRLVQDNLKKSASDTDRALEEINDDKKALHFEYWREDIETALRNLSSEVEQRRRTDPIYRYSRFEWIDKIADSERLAEEIIGGSDEPIDWFDNWRESLDALNALAAGFFGINPYHVAAQMVEDARHGELSREKSLRTSGNRF